MISWLIVILTLILISAVLLFVQLYRYLEKEIYTSVGLPSICAYTDQIAYRSGDDLKLFVHAEDSFGMTLYHIGENLEHLDIYPTHKSIIQSGKYSLWRGFVWNDPVKISLNKLQSGYYLIHLYLITSPTTVYNTPLLVRSSNDKPITIVASTNTWQAYNQFGGKSNYRDFVTPRFLQLLFRFLYKVNPGLAPKNNLPFHRPYSEAITNLDLKKDPMSIWTLNGEISAEYQLIRLLSKNNIDYEVISDSDFENLSSSEAQKLIVFHNHSEYWSRQAIGKMRYLYGQGMSFAFLSGNNMYREVMQTPFYGLQVENQFIDPSLIEPLIGTFYSEAGYNTYASYRILQPDHWIFNKVDPKSIDEFGGEASGSEMDKLGPNSTDFLLLAQGNNAFGGAQMVIKEDNLRKNYIFNASSESFVRGINSNPDLDQLVLNLVNSVLLNSEK
ncbi:MAG: hypothetical protein KDC80_28420 [Saprospiraceae bacterium]|nr:hypothetical protein [Saprospiraceae bacterium]